MTEPSSPLAKMLEVETEVSRVESSAVAVLNRSEVEAQLDAAHRYPRSAKRFMQEALSLATVTEEVAASCIYTLPRGDKPITGPSVRLAEICAHAWGNLHAGTRVLDVEEKEICSQGVAWDLEKNLRVTVEVRRKILDKKGRRYNDDMINVTGAAGGSVAYRNAIFRVIPRAYVDAIFAEVRKVAVGSAKTLDHRRKAVVHNFGVLGIHVDRVLEKVGKASLEDVGLDELEVLIGIGTAIKNGERTIDEFFPDAPAAGAGSTTRERGAEKTEKTLEEKIAERGPPPAKASHETKKQEVSAAPYLPPDKRSDAYEGPDDPPVPFR